MKHSKSFYVLQGEQHGKLDENMISTTKQSPLVQDLRNHSAEQVSELRRLLENGAPTKADPRRPGFFELQGLQNVFYIFKYPTGAKVLLLGVWERDPVAEMVDANCCCSA
jgi:hypothetical protein